MILAIKGEDTYWNKYVANLICYLLYVELSEERGQVPSQDLDYFMRRLGSGPWLHQRFDDCLIYIARELTCTHITSWNEENLDKEIPEKWWEYKQTYECDENNKDGYTLMPTTYREFLKQLESSLSKFRPNYAISNLFEGYFEQRVKVYEDDIPEYTRVLPNWVISDLRFNHEAQAVIQRQGYIIEVNTEAVQKSKNSILSYSPHYRIFTGVTEDEVLRQVRGLLKYFKLLANA